MSKMKDIGYRKVHDFPRGTLYALLKDAYSFDRRYERHCDADWREFDDFFYDNRQIADKYAFITTLSGEPIGLASWDPRNLPDYAIIGHNCIAMAHKGHGFGSRQLQEMVDRIVQNGAKRIVVTTDDVLLTAQRMYTSVGFKLYQTRSAEGNEGPAGAYLDYEYQMRPTSSS